MDMAKSEQLSNGILLRLTNTLVQSMQATVSKRLAYVCIPVSM